MKPITFLFLLSIFACNQSKTKQIKDQLKLEASVNDSLKTQILYNGDCSYSLSEIEGWIAYSEPIQKSDNIKILVMYKPNSSIVHSSPIGISSNVIYKNEYKDSTFKGFLKGEISSALDRGEKVIEDKSIKTQDHKLAIIKKYLIDGTKDYFAIAYIDEPKYIIMITFSSKNIDDYNNNYKSFEKIVQSYKYLGMIVIDETKK